MANDTRVIFFVDDEPDLVEVVGDALRLAFPTHEFVGSTTLEEARRRLSGIGDERLAVVVVDHRVGGSTGVALIEEIRARGLTKLPILLFTGQAPADIEARAKAAGAKVLWKPLRLAAFIEEIRRATAA